MADPKPKPNFAGRPRPKGLRTLSEEHEPQCAMRDRQLSQDERVRIGCTCQGDVPEWTL